jgi:hypothetical protein
MIFGVPVASSEQNENADAEQNENADAAMSGDCGCGDCVAVLISISQSFWLYRRLRAS